MRPSGKKWEKPQKNGGRRENEKKHRGRDKG